MNASCVFNCYSVSFTTKYTLSVLFFVRIRAVQIVLLCGTVISTSVRSLTGSFVKPVCIVMTFILLVPGKLEFYIPV